MTPVVFVFSVGQEIQIRPEGASISKAEGENVVFTCHALGVSQDTDVNLRWYNMNGQPIHLSSGR